MVVLGIDPGTTRMGYGVVLSDGRNFRSLEYGIVKTRSGTDLSERLADIYGPEFEDVFWEGAPER